MVRVLLVWPMYNFLQVLHAYDVSNVPYLHPKMLYYRKKTIHINHNKTLIQVSMLMLICYIFYRTHVPMAAVLVLDTPDDGRLRPKHVE
jgi:hypothetical protein